MSPPPASNRLCDLPGERAAVELVRPVLRDAAERPREVRLREHVPDPGTASRRP